MARRDERPAGASGRPGARLYLPQAMPSATEQSLPAYPASADTDVGPGQMEPVLVGAR
jgi:hypothetical protein